jgi:peptidoglycan/LPS O-acetylase OafA/YrhL
MWNFLAADNLTMWTADVEHPTKNVFADRTAFNALIVAHDVLKPTPFLRAGFWLLACVVIGCLGWRRNRPREAAFALAVCGSATIYLLSFYALGVASDFRYGYWAVLAAIAGGVVVISGGRKAAELPR